MKIVIVWTLLFFATANCATYNERMINAEVWAIEAVPYMAAVMEDRIHKFGGTILSEKFVSTTAQGKRGNHIQYSVRVGSNYSTFGGVLTIVSYYFVHPKFDSTTLEYDYGLLRLHKPITFSPTIQPIAHISDSALNPGRSLVVCGWGITFDEMNNRTRLHCTQLPKVEPKECREAYLNESRHFGATMMCAGLKTGGLGPCYGDTGGGLVYSNTLYGTVSWGRGCGYPDHPGVFARVMNGRNWIVEVMANDTDNTLTTTTTTDNAKNTSITTKHPDDEREGDSGLRLKFPILSCIIINIIIFNL